jgi:hypothetical protein
MLHRWAFWWGNLKKADHFEGLGVRKGTGKCLYACLEDIWGLEI